MAAEKPAVVRGCNRKKAASSTHVAARAEYKYFRVWNVSRQELNSNVRSYSSTMTGAVTIDSFDAMPDAQAKTESTCQEIECRGDRRARMAQYSVSRKNSAIMDSVRC